MQQPVLLFSLILLCTGCSSSQLAPSVGTVSFDDGEPVRSGSIEFRATSDGALYSSRIGASPNSNAGIGSTKKQAFNPCSASSRS